MAIGGTTRPAEPPGVTGTASVARNSATVAAWTLASRATGLLRVVVIGAVLGPTHLANTFLTTNQVPSLVYAVVAGQVLALVVVPAVVRTLREHSAADAAAHVRRLSGMLVRASGLVALALVPVSVGLGWVLTLGVPEADRGRAHSLAVVLLVLVAPQIVLYTVAAAGAAVQQARGRFALAAAAPAVENVGLITTMAAVAVVYGRPPDVGEVPLGAVLLLGTGATLSVAIHTGLQLFGAARVGLSLRPARGWRDDPESRAVAARLRSSVVVAAMPAASLFLLLAAAATVPGGALVFQMAFAVYAVPTAIGARAVTTAVLPGMSAAVKGGDSAGFARSWRQALFYGTVAGLPALCVLVTWPGTVAGVLAAGEARTEELLATLTVCIAVMGVAQLASGFHEIGRQALYARLDVRGPQVAGVIGFAVTAVAAGLALLLPAGLPRLAGLCCAVLLADTAGAAAVIARVGRAVRPERAVDGRRLAIAVAAAAAMLPVLAGGRVLAGEGGPLLRELVVLAAAALLATAVFAGALSLLVRTRAGTP